jgi:uncharacterized protein with von Willebrand factor type A (vWA) domain
MNPAAELAWPPPPSGGHLLHNLLLFGRVLRGLGLDVNPGRMMDLVQALAVVDIGRRDDVYFAARSLLVHRQEDLALFDQAFVQFWRPPSSSWLTGLWVIGARQRRRARVVPAPLKKPAEAAEGGDEDHSDDRPPVIEVTHTYSASEALRHKDFSQLTAEEYGEIKALIAHLAWELDRRRTRRRRPGGGPQIDFRHTLRRNLKYGGNLLEWAYRERKYKPRPLVVLADVSGSMERYTRLLLHFVYGLTLGLGQPVESFVFGTRLTRITRHLEHEDVEEALREVSSAVVDWSGGTRIGESLKAFNYTWGRRVLGRGAVVLMISDGWDRGEPELLAREMARLQRTCFRLIWLNPLLGSPEYEPLTRGIQAALPYVDDFLPVHNLASLEELANRLAGLDRQRRR